MTRLVRHLVLAAALALLVVPAPAYGSARDVIRDCSFDDDLDRDYSNRELREARNHLPSEIAEYSLCADVISAAMSGGSDKSGGAGSPGVGGSDPGAENAARATDQSDLQAITGAGGSSPSVDVGGTSLKPDSSGFFGLGNAANKVPLPLVLALILLAVMALASGVGGLRERVPALARIPLISKLPRLRVPFVGRRS